MNSTKIKLVLSCLAVLLMSNCHPDPAYAEQMEKVQKQHDEKVKSTTLYDYGMLHTVEHDKHLFIVEGRHGKGAILHHPDCPCGKP